MDTAAGLALACAALYGLGLPLAWLFPAPLESPWVFRICVAPLYSIVATSLTAWLLGGLDVRLDPRQLLLMAVVAWTWAWVRTRQRWAVREALRGALAPAALVAAAGVAWVLSLYGFGLYLPNRDFKNHAYFVAQVAWTRSADLSLVLRPSPVSAPEDVGFYPLGLHTLLGWALPSVSSPSVAITAGGAVLATAISMPLAVVALARLWDPRATALWVVSGAAAVFVLGLTADFRIGSVVLLVASSLYPAGLVALWLWVRQPSLAAAAGLAMCGAGLFLLHVAEAVGLGLVLLACLPLALRTRASRLRPTTLAVAGLGVVLAWLVVRHPVGRLVSMAGSGFDWDLQRNDLDPVTAGLVALLQQPSGQRMVALAWIALALVGFWMAQRRGWDRVPLIVFMIPVLLGTIAGMAAAPGWLNLLTAPWYGTAARTGLLAVAPMILAASLTLVGLWTRARSGVPRALAAALVVTAVAALAVQVVPSRRTDLRLALAGAGDTEHLARQLAARLQPGQTVLNFEGDGTANLFAYARVPVLAGLAEDQAITQPAGSSVAESLLDLADPSVARRLDDLGVAFIAVGTTSRYWGQGVAYPWEQLAGQPQVRLEAAGTDMVLLRYLGGSR